MIAEQIKRITEVVKKEFHQLFRDPRMWRIIFVAPVIQLILFGYAVSTDIKHTETFVVDYSQSQESRELINVITASGYFDVAGRSMDINDAVKALDHEEALVGVVIPADFVENLHSTEGAAVQLLLDGSQSNSATVAQGYIERIVQDYASHYSAKVDLAIELRERAWFNPDLASKNYNVPAVSGAIIFLICLLLTSLAVVREREIGTLEQLMVSPLSSFELIAGKTIPFALIGLVDVMIVTIAALFWFQVPFVGNYGLLFLSSLLFIISSLAIGLLISTVSKTQQEAFMSSFLVFMPTILLSGLMFPISSMPIAFQWLTLLNPMRHYLDIVRGIFLKGSGVIPLWPQYAALLIIGLAILAVASGRFRKQIN